MMKERNKKSQGLSLNIIVTAVIVLIVLGIVFAIFTNTTRKIAKNIGDCENKGGVCASTLGGECNDEYPVPLIVSKDCVETSNNLCCLITSNN